MAVIAGVEYGPSVVKFPWEKKWALMCLEVGSKEGPKRAQELCEVLSKEEQDAVEYTIRNFRTELLAR